MSEKEKTKAMAEITEGPKPSPDYFAAAEQAGARLTAWDPRMVEGFVMGQLTLADLEGIPKKDLYAMAERGHVLLTEGKLAQAKRVFEGLHALDPFDAYFLLLLGSIAQQEGNLDDAEHLYSRALEINPYFVPARAGRGEVRVLKGALLEAVDDFERVAADDPQEVNPATKRAKTIAQTLMKNLIEERNRAGNQS